MDVTTVQIYVFALVIALMLAALGLAVYGIRRTRQHATEQLHWLLDQLSEKELLRTRITVPAEHPPAPGYIAFLNELGHGRLRPLKTFTRIHSRLCYADTTSVAITRGGRTLCAFKIEPVYCEEHWLSQILDALDKELNRLG